MEKQSMQPERITKPIQLLGAWLAGLLTIDASFLFAATKMTSNSWQSGALTVAAIVNVPVFIGALFILQTKFRPELQEDSYYATYLNNKTNQRVRIPKKDAYLEELEARIESLEGSTAEVADDIHGSQLSSLSFGVNVHLENQGAIEEALFEEGVELIRIFGKDVGAPDVARVAVAANMPVQIRNAVFRLARKLGIEHYSIIEPWEEIDEDVLFGAYGDTEGKITHMAT
ncbi:hypothetical protein [Marinobacter sp.]|uniref:hypothetical protein n=1 Tax=Marinobacter sp. TaxID=50741 RepID=UPI00356515B3